MFMTTKKKMITSFKAKPYRTNNKSSGSTLVVVPKSKFDENILQRDKRYEFSVSEVTE